MRGKIPCGIKRALSILVTRLVLVELDFRFFNKSAAHFVSLIIFSEIDDTLDARVDQNLCTINARKGSHVDRRVAFDGCAVSCRLDDAIDLRVYRPAQVGILSRGDVVSKPYAGFWSAMAKAGRRSVVPGRCPISYIRYIDQIPHPIRNPPS